MRKEKSKNCPREYSSRASKMKNNISLVRLRVCKHEEEMLCDRDRERDFVKMFSCAVVTLTVWEAGSKRAD